MLNFDENGNPIRGIRTFGEIAHFVRCIPFEHRESFGLINVWCSPDFVLKRKLGNEFDHALLMASLFRSSKNETTKEFNKWCLKMKKEKKSKRMEQLEKFKHNKSEGGGDQEGDNSPKADQKYTFSG